MTDDRDRGSGRFDDDDEGPIGWFSGPTSASEAEPAADDQGEADGDHAAADERSMVVDDESGGWFPSDDVGSAGDLEDVGDGDGRDRDGDDREGDAGDGRDLGDEDDPVLDDGVEDDIPSSSGRRARRYGSDRAARGPRFGGRLPAPVAIGAAVLLVVALLAVWLFVLRDDGSVPDDVVVRVDGTSLSVDDFNRRLQATEVLYGIPSPEAGTPENDQYLRDYAQSETLRLVFEHEAEKRGVIIAQRQVQDELARLIEQRYPVGGRDAFVAQLGDAGVSEAEVVNELRRGLLNQLLFTEIVDPGEITDEEVAGEYEALRDELAVGEGRVLRHLVVATEEEAQAARARIDGGEAFADVARDVSLDATTAEDGGVMGTLQEDLLDPAFGTPAFAAAAGDVFGPVQTDLGWHIGLVEEVVAPRTLTLEEVLEPLRENLTFRCQQTQWRSFIADALADADIDYNPAYEPEDPDAPPPLTLAPETSAPADDDAAPSSSSATPADELADPSICDADE